MRRRVGFTLVAVVLAGCRPGGVQDAEELKPVVKTAEADGMKLTVSVSRTAAAVGDQVSLELLLDGAGDNEVMWPALEEELDGFHVRRLPQVEPAAAHERGEKVPRRAYQLRPLEPGALTIPGVEVRVVPPPTTTQPADETVLTTEPVVVTVAGVASAEANPTSRPAATDQPLALARERRLGWVVWLAGLLAVAAGAVLLARWLRRRRARPPAAPVIPPDQWALEQLRRLRERELIRGGRVQEFYFELNMIVRQYIERRFGLRAPEMTTEEFLLSLRGEPTSGRLDQRAQEALLPFLEACDLVKYARYQPAAAEIQDVDRTAERFVIETARDDGAAPPPGKELDEILEKATP